MGKGRKPQTVKPGPPNKPLPAQGSDTRKVATCVFSSPGTAAGGWLRVNKLVNRICQEVTLTPLLHILQVTRVRDLRMLTPVSSLAWAFPVRGMGQRQAPHMRHDTSQEHVSCYLHKE